MPKQHRVNFDDLKARADFRAVLLHYRINLFGLGDQAKVHCPFHDDERPSCSVNLAEGLFHCFGCQAKGNVLEFVHRLETRDGEAVSLRLAGVRLAEICGIDVNGSASRRQEPHREATAKKTAVPPSGRQNRAVGVPERQETASGNSTEPTRNKPLGFRLTLDPEHPYLRERGISEDAILLFKLGGCSHGSMAGRVCVPIHDALGGQVIAYAGRWAGALEGLPEGEEKWKLPKGFHKSLELFNLNRVWQYRHLIVVEGFFDAIRLHGLRFPAVAVMGTSITDEQIALLREHCVKPAGSDRAHGRRHRWP
jgi:DNA primase